MRIQLRIVAGSLKGRKITSVADPNLRPTPDMVREALFSILGNAVPDRRFFDVFAGTGAVGMEALSRGATEVTFIERDFRLAGNIGQHLEAFGVARSAQVQRADAYRWVERWQPPNEPVTVFISPPFADFERRLDDLMLLVGELQQKTRPGSVIVLQAEKSFDPVALPAAGQWEKRLYGRNQLLIWVHPEENPAG